MGGIRDFNQGTENLLVDFSHLNTLDKTVVDYFLKTLLDFTKKRNTPFPYIDAYKAVHNIKGKRYILFGKHNGEPQFYSKNGEIVFFEDTDSIKEMGGLELDLRVFVVE